MLHDHVSVAVRNDLERQKFLKDRHRLLERAALIMAVHQRHRLDHGNPQILTDIAYFVSERSAADVITVRRTLSIRRLRPAVVQFYLNDASRWGRPRCLPS